MLRSPSTLPTGANVGIGGIEIACSTVADEHMARQDILALVGQHALAGHLQFRTVVEGAVRTLVCHLPDAVRAGWAPGHDTLGLAARMGLAQARDEAALQQEIIAALLLGPEPQRFPSRHELGSALRIRANVVRAARLTTLAFDTRAIERPADCWVYDDDRGFMIRPGVSLIEALRKATQPGVSGSLYAFSCYRATEYVFLLGLAEELVHCNPALYAALEQVWQHRAIASAAFHDVFLRETGSLADPLPPRYYVPGDRVWFRNPDPVSADASGYEGSWVFYLGGGLFSNFWVRGQPFSFDGKCVEVYHWRHATWLDAEGELRIDEARVAEHLARTRSDPAAWAAVLARMQRYRDPRGVYADGGCIDSTREQARWVCPGTSDLVLPELP